MTGKEIVDIFINFYKDRGHAEIPNVSLIPKEDPTLLFINSGMFPLVPYLSGQPHPLGKRLVNVQRSIRFEDMPEVGNERHTTFFHMLGNWSLGDYFKEEQLTWAYELYIDVLGLNPSKIYASVFEGDEHAPKDEESIKIIKEIFDRYGINAKEGERIFAMDKSENWWQRGETIGELGGPDSEIFYDTGAEHDENIYGPRDTCQPGCDCPRFLEVGNSVFMQYVKTEEGWNELPQKNVDFGGGLERLAMITQGKKDIFESELFFPIIKTIENLSNQNYNDNTNNERSMRILADHIRAATFLLADGVAPSNKDQGYALRRILRRIVRYSRNLGLTVGFTKPLAKSVVEVYSNMYPNLIPQAANKLDIFVDEEKQFAKTLERGMKEFRKINLDNAQQLGELAFQLYQSTGLPPEMFEEELLLANQNFSPQAFWDEYNDAFESHQSISREGANKKFASGLADTSEETTKLHTTTHLLHQALRHVLGNHVQQKGSNITAERLRFDFSHEKALTDNEIQQVEQIVNKNIQANLPVTVKEMPYEDAIKQGALAFFDERYPDVVTVYSIGEISKEVCTGPHVEHTGELGQFKITKQESVGKGIRRVRAILV